MRQYVLTDEQQHSLAEALADAGVRHGDTVEVDIATGALPAKEGSGVHLAYCSSSVRLRRIISVGSAEERAQPIQGRVAYDQPEVLARKLHGHRGVVRMTAVVHTNGHIAVRVQPDSVRRFNVQGADNWYFQTAEGKQSSKEALALA